MQCRKSGDFLVIDEKLANVDYKLATAAIPFMVMPYLDL